MVNVRNELRMGEDGSFRAMKPHHRMSAPGTELPADEFLA
jgi:hypothetical protein